MSSLTVVRAGPPAVVREDGQGGSPLLFGRFSPFNSWVRISSWLEGDFYERFVPGSFLRTFREDRSRIRALYAHGRDAAVGDRPLGPIVTLRERPDGAHFEVRLLDEADYVRELLPALRAGLFGSSHRFMVMREERLERPPASAYNPERLPERTVLEAKIFEVSVVTFPAYEGATAAVRSLTDDWVLGRLGRAA